MCPSRTMPWRRGPQESRGCARTPSERNDCVVLREMRANSSRRVRRFCLARVLRGSQDGKGPRNLVIRREATSLLRRISWAVAFLQRALRVNPAMPECSSINPDVRPRTPLFLTETTGPLDSLQSAGFYDAPSLDRVIIGRLRVVPLLPNRHCPFRAACCKEH